MGIVVQKYGGKLVRNNEKMKQVANIIATSFDKGEKVVVVVSAMGDTTDNLNNQITQITQVPSKREVDVVLACGEQISMGLLSIMLNDMGYKAISLSGYQAGILTDSNYTDANIININANIINQYLNEDYIVIVAGFQGYDEHNNVTTLGRGGSDTTATQLAAVLNADVCEIYKDTKSVCTADPKLIKTAKKINNINYEHMLLLSKMGAKVLAYKSIEFARDNHINLVIKSVEDDSIGTRIDDEDSENKYPIISCTKMKYDANQNMLSFILNNKYDNNIDVLGKMKYILFESNIDEDKIKVDDVKISILVNNQMSDIVLKKIHDELIV